MHGTQIPQGHIALPLRDGYSEFPFPVTVGFLEGYRVLRSVYCRCLLHGILVHCCVRYRLWKMRGMALL
jgi:hypothetical protein